MTRHTDEEIEAAANRFVPLTEELDPASAQVLTPGGHGEGRARNVRFVGLDLAWGENAWTGVAVLDEHGRLMEMGRVKTDDEIERRLASHLSGPVVVGIDAPLVVRNVQGRRPCESQVSRIFGRFHAGAHSSNLSLPSFRDGPRGGRVAQRLRLDVNPAFERRTDVQRAIEVYPHPATVTLFGLDKILPYKNKPGRSPVDRRIAFIDLMDHTSRLDQAEPGLSVSESAAWASARAAVEAATTHRELNEWEDAIDAVLCAYVARHRWWFGDAQSAVFGDVENGYIVVPLDDRVRAAAATASAPLSNREVEQLAVELLRRQAEEHGREVHDTRHQHGAVADLVIDGRLVEVKASATSIRGQDVWLEPRQAQGLRDGTVDLALVEHVQSDGRGVVRWVRASALATLPPLREHHYYTLPLPTASYDALAAEDVGPRE